jgi:hypothetical protein
MRVVTAISEASIVNLLATNDKAIARALMALREKQTYDEQVQKDTKYRNYQGFRPCHARMGTEMAEFYMANGYLTPRQVAFWRARTKDGKMRIAIYAGQLAKIAAEKQAQ